MMQIPIILSIAGSQSYMEQEPERIELVTEGTLKKTGEGWEITYQESALTGLEGVTTTFRVVPDEITLKRVGKLNSEMVFHKGTTHNSLYQMEFGALMLTVCATEVSWNISESGGTIDLVYGIEIEQSSAGVIEYHLEIKAK